jgi:hypothetical protein
MLQSRAFVIIALVIVLTGMLASVPFTVVNSSGGELVFGPNGLQRLLQSRQRTSYSLRELTSYLGSPIRQSGSPQGYIWVTIFKDWSATEYLGRIPLSKSMSLRAYRCEAECKSESCDVQVDVYRVEREHQTGDYEKLAALLADPSETRKIAKYLGPGIE